MEYTSLTIFFFQIELQKTKNFKRFLIIVSHVFLYVYMFSLAPAILLRLVYLSGIKKIERMYLSYLFEVFFGEGIAFVSLDLLGCLNRNTLIFLAVS
jgi:hypothetical protein